MTGQTLAGRYRVARELGTGRLGVVYAAVDTKTGKEVAVKLFHPGFPADEQFAAEFAHLMTAVGVISAADSRILPLYDWEQAEDGTPLSVMDLAGGRSLKAIVEEAGSGLPLERALANAPEKAAGHYKVPKIIE